MAFQAGYNKAAAWQYESAGSAQTLDIQGHSWKEQIDALDVTSTGHNGTQALIAGILRGDGTIKLVVNSSTILTNITGLYRIRAGQNGVMWFHVGYVNPYKVPCMIVSVGHQSAVEGKVECEIQVRLNKDASAITYAAP